MERVIKKGVGVGVKDKACGSTECIIQCKHIPDVKFFSNINLRCMFINC